MCRLNELLAGLAIGVLVVMHAGITAADAAEADESGRVKVKMPAAADGASPLQSDGQSQSAPTMTAPGKTSEAIHPPILDDRSYDQLPAGQAQEGNDVQFGDGIHGRRPPAGIPGSAASPGREPRKDLSIEVFDQAHATAASLATEIKAQVGPELRRQGVSELEVDQLARRAAAAFAAQRGRGEARGEVRECTRDGACVRVVARQPPQGR
jgi:hypothetical protein